MAIVPFVSFGFLMEFSSERVLYLTDTTLMNTTDSLKFIDSYNCFFSKTLTGDVRFVNEYSYSLYNDHLNTFKSGLKHKSTRFIYTGRLVSEGILSDEKTPFQRIPKNYARLILSNDLKIGYVPLKFYSILTTEHQKLSHQMTTGGISFNQADFKAALKENMTSDIKKESLRKSRATNNLPLEMKIDERMQQLSQLRNIDSLSLTKPSLLNDTFPIRRDVLLKDSIKVGGFNRKIDYEYDSLLQIKDKLNLIKANNEIELNKELYKLEDQNNFRQKFKQSRFNTPIYKLLFSIDKLELGNCNPEYGKLSLYNSSLTGVNIQLNPAVWYVGLAAGNLINQMSVSSVSNSLNNTPTIALKAGLGNLQRNYFGIHILKFKGSTVTSTDTATLHQGYSYKSAFDDNTVFGLNAQYYLNADLKIYAEINTSNNALNNFKSESDASKIKLDYAKDVFRGMASRNAVMAVISYNLKLTRSKFYAEYRKVDPFYFSAGASYLRRDNRRYELRYNQQLMKNKIELGLSTRIDTDNLTKQKTYTTSINTNTITLTLRPVRFYFVSSVVSTGKQAVSSDAIQLYSIFLVSTVCNGFNYRIGGKPMSTIVSYTYQEYTSVNSLLNRKESQVALDQTISLLGRRNFVSTTRLMSSITKNKQDSIGIFQFSQSFSFEPFKRVSISTGYTYSEDAYISGRHGMNAGIRYTTTKLGTFDLTYERNGYQYNKFIYPQSYTIQNRLLMSYTKNF
jgi:hypothetical protein